MIRSCRTDCQKKYEYNSNVLTKAERRKLSRAIVKYFRLNRIRVKSEIAKDLAKQIMPHFHTERDVCQLRIKSV